MSEKNRPAEVAEAHPALLEMLESLLAEVPEASPPPTEPEPAPKPAPAPAAPPPRVVPEAPVEEPLNNPAAPPLQRTRECVVYGTDARTLDTPESSFSAIKFGVGRFRFVAPLNMLDSVASIADRPTPMFGQPDWHRGVVVNRGQQLVLVDPGALLGLEGVEPVTSAEHVLVLPGGRLGLLSSVPPEPLTLRGGDIRWSRPDPRRAWMAAILPDEMCVMVDVEAFAEQIQARILPANRSGPRE